MTTLMQESDDEIKRHLERVHDIFADERVRTLKDGTIVNGNKVTEEDEQQYSDEDDEGDDAPTPAVGINILELIGTLDTLFEDASLNVCLTKRKCKCAVSENCDCDDDNFFAITS